MAVGDYISFDMWDDFHDYRGNEPVTYQWTRFVHDTRAAWLLVIHGAEFWIPKSQCTLDIKKKMVTMPDWLRIAKRLR